jgi:hypothetical protein
MTFNKPCNNWYMEELREHENSFFNPVALWPNAGHGILILEFSRSYIVAHYNR